MHLQYMLSFIIVTELRNSSPLEEDCTRIQPHSTSKMANHLDQYSAKLPDRLKTLHYSQNRN